MTVKEDYRFNPRAPGNRQEIKGCGLLIEGIADMVRRSYDRIAPMYARGRSWSAWQTKEINRFMRYLPEGGRVLDLGCGTGGKLKLFHERGFRVVGIDQSPQMVRHAERFIPRGRFYNRGMVNPGFRAESFDGVMSFFAIFHVPHGDQPEVFRQIHRLLVPGGHFLITLADYGKLRTYIGPHCGEWMYWSGVSIGESFRRLRRVGFEILWHKELGPRDDRNTWIVGRKRG